MKDRIEKIFFENLKYYGNQPEKRQLIETYYRLFSIKALEGDLSESLLYLYEENKKFSLDIVMFDFLKSLRQGDFYEHVVVVQDNNLCTPEEIDRRKYLLSVIEESRINHKLKGPDQIIDTEIWNKEYKKHQDKTKEVRMELQKLNSKFHNTENVSIAGHLDMLLYNVLNYDENLFLKVMKRTFFDYSEEIKNT